MKGKGMEDNSADYATGDGDAAETLRRFGGNPLRGLSGTIGSSGKGNAEQGFRTGSDGFTAPPENMAEHLKRIGAEDLFRVLPVLLDGKPKPVECLVIPWEELQQREYNYLASGAWMKGNGNGNR